MPNLEIDSPGATGDAERYNRDMSQSKAKGSLKNNFTFYTQMHPA
jgi:hypothetical protein